MNQPPVTQRILARPIVLIGMMGSGKSSVGRKLAARLSLPFADFDQEIETAAGCSVTDFFARYGEDEFRAGERRVINRLLEQPLLVLATGGGAFMDPATRDHIRHKAVAVWLKATPDTILKRVGHRTDRPLLQRYDNPETAVAALIAEREPTYALADLTVPSGDRPVADTATLVLQNLIDFAARPEHAAAKFLVIS